MKAEQDSEKSKRRSQADLLIEAASDAVLFHHEDKAYATIIAPDHFETWSLRSNGFRRWLMTRFYEWHQKSANSNAIQAALDSLEGMAICKGKAIPVFTRFAIHEDKLFLDLANHQWEAVEITGAGWKTIGNPPVKFRRPRGMMPLPQPESGASLQELRPFVNVNAEEWPLLIGWLIGALRPRGPYPILIVHGEQGSAKTSLTKVLRNLIDPNVSPLRAEPREIRDLMIGATNNWILALDNLSHLQPWLSDALCRLSTGGGFATRELYADDQETLFNVERPVILNGIEELANRSDLLSRALLLYLPPIPPEQRRTQEEFDQAFKNAHPRLLGALLDTICAAMRNVASVRLDRLPRMADFAKWVTAAEPLLGWPNGFFLQNYADNQEAASSLTLEVSALTGPLMNMTASGPWKGTATELLHMLNNHAEESIRRSKAWPQSAQILSNALRRLAPSLRVSGLDLTFRAGRQRTITLERTGAEASPASSLELAEEISSSSGDGDDADDGLFGACANDNAK